MYGRENDDYHVGSAMFELDITHWMSSEGVANSSTHVSEPVEITCYSRDDSRRVTLGSREQLRTYSEPQLQSNLGDGFGTYVPKVDGDAGMEPVLQALLNASFDVDGQADIVTYRNNLNKIGTAPYENRDAWEFDCVLVGKTVFLDIRQIGVPPPSSQQRFMYYGYRFEALCTGASNEPVNANSEFCSISRIRIANHRILLSSEIDCTQSTEGQDNPLRRYVELKTMRSIENSRGLDNMYRHRFLKYWLQSYLAGVRNIALGIRSDDGTLLQVKHLKTSGIPREAREHFEKTRSRNTWNPFVCINFLDCVLAYIRTACQAKPGHTIRVRMDPSTKKIQGVLIGSPAELLAPRIRHVQRRGENPR